MTKTQQIHSVQVAEAGWPCVLWAAKERGGKLAKSIGAAEYKTMKRGAQHIVAVPNDMLADFVDLMEHACAAPEANTQTRRACRRVRERLAKQLDPDLVPPAKVPKPQVMPPSSSMAGFLNENPEGVWEERGGDKLLTVAAVRVGRYALRMVCAGGTVLHCGLGYDMELKHEEPMVQVFDLESRAPAERWPSGCAWCGRDYLLSEFMRLRTAMQLNQHMPHWVLEKNEILEGKNRLRYILSDANSLPEVTRKWLKKASTEGVKA